jgi:hypothetical protein
MQKYIVSLSCPSLCLPARPHEMTPLPLGGGGGGLVTLYNAVILLKYLHQIQAVLQSDKKHATYIYVLLVFITRAVFLCSIWYDRRTFDKLKTKTEADYFL